MLKSNFKLAAVQVPAVGLFLQPVKTKLRSNLPTAHATQALTRCLKTTCEFPFKLQGFHCIYLSTSPPLFPALLSHFLSTCSLTFLFDFSLFPLSLSLFIFLSLALSLCLPYSLCVLHLPVPPSTVSP